MACKKALQRKTHTSVGLLPYGFVGVKKQDVSWQRYWQCMCFYEILKHSSMCESHYTFCRTV